jgi:cell fate regulator YaaT (PSP1 superfamily)
MPTIVGVRLRFVAKPLYFEVNDPAIAHGASVVVKTERGLELGQVVAGSQEPDETSGPGPFDAIERVATAEDLRAAEELAEREREAMKVYRELVKERGLDMKPIDVEYVFDGSKIVFYFVAEERVDFRDLVRDLASRFHARIDMRQVGVRDEARMVGGLGHCGEQLCCTRFGGDFQPVSIRMAKEQDLPLNPLKISGLCGRLMCCLRYEFEVYKEFKGRAPKRNAIIELPEGAYGKVIDLNTPKEEVTMLLEGGGRMTVPLTAMDCAKNSDGCGCPCRVRAEALPQKEESMLSAAAPLTVTSDEPRSGKGRSRQPRASREGAGTAQPAEQPAQGEQQPSRRRRRRGGGGGGASAGGGKPAEGAAASQPKPAQAQPTASGEAPASGEQQAAGTGRRRRRRRAGGGGAQASKAE